jgi:transposase-like protein
MKIRLYSEEMIRKIRETYKKTSSLRKAAKLLDINLKTVSRYVQDLISKDKRMKSKIRYPIKTHERARELYKQTGSIYKVAKKLNIPSWTIHSWIGDLIPKYSNYGRFKYDKKEARELYKKLKSIYKVAKHFNVNPATVGNWVEDLIPVSRTVFERKIEKLLRSENIPYDKVILKGRSRNYTPDFVIPPTNPKLFIEVKENNRKDYQQWHRMCLLFSKKMAFDVIDIKFKYPDITAIGVINRIWNKTSMKVLETYFDKVFTNKNLNELNKYIKKVIHRR